MIFFDFEVFCHDWLVVLASASTQTFQTIVNDKDELQRFYETHVNDIWVGYNCRGYDQYILKSILLDMNPYDVSHFIIVEGRKGWEYSSAFRQIPLHIFDIMTSFHGLKQLEGFMGHDIRESQVQFNLDRKLTEDELTETIKYCHHDVQETIEVFLNRKDEFDSHMSLIKAFQLPLDYLGKTKPQLSAIILGARRVHGRKDEFDLVIPDTLRVEKYTHILDWYQDETNHDYKKSLETNVAGVPHVFAWGGLHGAIDHYHGDGVFLNIDVASYYPALMIEYDFLSRNVSDPKKYCEIRDKRLEFKVQKNPLQAPYKIVLNSTYGAMKDKFNGLYDPRQANNVCVNGQLFLLDLIECLEDHCQLIQSNTDGLIVKIESQDEIETIKKIAHEWEIRTRMNLEFEQFKRIYQKDVNNYIVIKSDGSHKSKGAYVKKLDVLDNDLPIVNRALIDYFTKNIPVEQTILESTNLMEFQKIVKVSSKYMFAVHNNTILKERVLRVFASRSRADGPVQKRKTADRIEKIANTPERCFIQNNEVNWVPIPRKLDVNWYIKVAQKRLNDFIDGR